MGSGDFTDQATEPQPVDWDRLWKDAAKGALNDMEINYGWEDIPLALAEYALDTALIRLIEKGQQNATVHDLALSRGIVYEDGSWT